MSLAADEPKTPAARTSTRPPDAPWWRRDLTSPAWIILKGMLFPVIATLATAVVFITPGKGPVFIAAYALAIWACCRGYYFAFYVITHYVDGGYKFAGLIDFAGWLWRRRRAGRATAGEPRRPQI